MTAPITLQLDAASAAALFAVVEARLHGMSSEIRRTDTPRVRQELRDERELLRALLEQLQPVAA